MKRLFVTVAAFSMIFSYPLTPEAQENPPLNIIRQVTGEDGILTYGIKYTIKDSDGFMWFSYANGFNRWDGYGAMNIEEYLSDTNINSSYRYCRPMLEDERGYLYVGTLRNGLVRLDRTTNRYEHFVNEPNNPQSLGGDGIHAMMIDDEGIIWLGTFVFGLSRFDPVTETFRNYMVDPTVRYPWDCNNVRSLYKDSRGIFWVGSSNGLYQFDEETETFTAINVPIPIPSYLNYFESIVEDVNGDMWFGTAWGIIRYSRITGEWQHIETSNPDKLEFLADNRIYNMVEYCRGSKHQLWLATEAGLKAYDINTGLLTHFTPKNGYPEITNAGSVQYVFLDENDILWASLEGITLIDLHDNPFQVYHMKSYPDSLYDTPAMCFYEDGEGTLWIGTQRDGVYRYNRNMEFVANYKACNWDPKKSDLNYNNSVIQIYEDQNGRMWICTGPSGLCLFDKKTGTFKDMQADVGAYRPHGILMDSFGILWIYAHEGMFTGELTLEEELILTKYENPTLPRVPIDQMLEDSRGRLWIITRASGVYCLTPENRDSMIFRRYLHENYRNRFTIEFNVRTMIEDPWGELWFRSERGIFRYDPARDSILPDHFFNNHFHGTNSAIHRDHNGVVWLVSGGGLIQYFPGDTVQAAIRTMDHGTGLPYTFITTDAIFECSRGYLYCGGQETTARGFFRFHPDSVRGPNKTIPPVVLTKFEVKNQPFPLDSNITHLKHLLLEHDQNFFSFEFSALNYIDQGKNQYAFMLEGLDDDWVYSGNRRYANYTGVPPGNYVFRVKGSNNDGYWNEKGASITVTILKPPWKSWWASMLYGLFIAAIIILIAWYYLKRQQLRHALALEQVRKEKLEEMDQLKSRFFANISHEFRTPLTLIIGIIEKLRVRLTDEPGTTDLNIMQRNSMRLRRLIDQLLSLSSLEAGQMKLKSRQVNLVKVVRDYLQFFESAALRKGILLNFSSEKDEVPCFVDRDKMEKILYNLFSNALKFTHEGGSVSVEVSGQRSAVITVADTGPGISPTHLPHIFDRFYQADNTDTRFQEGSGIGLALVKELVELHHGQITVESEPGKGTKFIVHLPFGKEHLSPDEIDIILDDETAIAESYEKSVYEEAGLMNEVNGQPTAGDITGKPMVLLVEDNSDMRYYLRNILQGQYLCIEAVDGGEGLEKAIEKIPDLVVSDIMMPVMDGQEMCRRLRTDERTSHIPVILLTAKSSMEDRLEGLETGADDFITKPFQPSELLIRAKNLVEQRRALRDKYRKEFEHISLIPDKGMGSMDARFMEKAREVLGKNLSNPDFDTMEFSRQMNLSRVQLHRKLHALFNLSATAFIRTYRLNAAARLLEAKTGNVAQIAYEVGFNNLSYFSKCFREQFGVNPSEY